jgi:outer membrane biosynthesis protein TonB
MSSPAAMPPETVELKLEDNTQNPHRSTDLLDAWRQINGHLTSAVLISKEAVAAKKLQRRFWMEEICANVTEEGKLTYKSVWKRPVPSKKIAAAAKKTVTKKRKKAEPKSKKMTAKKKKTEKKQEQTNEDSKVVAPKKLTLKLKKPPTEAPRQEAAAGEEVEQESQDTSDEENHSESEMVSATKAAYQSDSMHNDREGSHESSSYGRVPSWGSSQHDNYMVSHICSFLLCS